MRNPLYKQSKQHLHHSAADLRESNNEGATNPYHKGLVLFIMKFIRALNLKSRIYTQTHMQFPTPTFWALELEEILFKQITTRVLYFKTKTSDSSKTTSIFQSVFTFSGFTRESLSILWMLILVMERCIDGFSSLSLGVFTQESSKLKDLWQGRVPCNDFAWRFTFMNHKD